MFLFMILMKFTDSTLYIDRDWSRQQNVIINSCLRNVLMTKEQFFKMKGEDNYQI